MGKIYKTQGLGDLFSTSNRREQLLALGNPLAKLSGAIDFELFRAPLTEKLYPSHRLQSGARPFDPVLLLKVLVIQNLYQLSDHQLQYQITD